MPAQASAAPEEFQHQIGDAAERRPQKPRAVETALQKHAFAVREGLEPELAVIGADSGGADTTERKILRREMKQRRIDRGAARDGLAQDVVALAGIGTEIIERKRARVPVDVIDRLVE